MKFLFGERDNCIDKGLSYDDGANGRYFSFAYLPLMGVDPKHQRQGLGSALLKHALIACDSGNQLAYLEASSHENLALYERHGFGVIGTIQVGSSPPIFSMLREPNYKQKPVT